MQTTDELRKSDAKKLQGELKQVKADLFKARFENVSGQSKDNHVIKVHSKQVARIETIIKEKSLTSKK